MLLVRLFTYHAVTVAIVSSDTKTLLFSVTMHQTIVESIGGVAKSMNRYMKLKINNFAIVDTRFYEPSSLDAIGNTSLQNAKDAIVSWEKMNPASDEIHNMIISKKPIEILDILRKKYLEEVELIKNVLRILDTFIPRLFRTQELNFKNHHEDTYETDKVNQDAFCNITCKKLP